MKTKSKITVTIILTAIVSGAAFGGLSYYQSRQAVSQAAFTDIEALRDAKSTQIVEFFDKKTKAVSRLSRDVVVATAVTDLQTAYRNVNQGGETVLADTSSNVRDYYERRALPPIAKSLGVPNASYDIYGPKTRAARHLQNVFNAPPKSSKAPRAKSYEALHSLYDDKLKSMAAVNGFADILLIDTNEGDVIYSVNKGIDFGTNVYNGPFAKSALGQIVEAVKNTSDLQISDIELYVPARSEASVFIAVPVYDQNIPIAIMAARLKAEQVSALSAFGLKERGDRDIYLTGSDYLMRSNVPMAQTNLNAYVRMFKDAGGLEDTAKRIKLGRSTILAQTVETDAVSAALNGESGVMQTQNYLGAPVISAYAPINIGQNDWVILAERSEASVYAPFKAFTERIAIAAAIFLPFLLLLALWIASRLMRPARAMMETARGISDGDNLKFTETNTEWGQIGKELNKGIVFDSWQASVVKRELSPRKPIKLISVDVPQEDEPVDLIENDIDAHEGEASPPEPAAVSKRPKRAARSDAGFKSGAFPDRVMAPRERRETLPPMSLVVSQPLVPENKPTLEIKDPLVLTPATEIDKALDREIGIEVKSKTEKQTEAKIVPLTERHSRFRRRRR